MFKVIFVHLLNLLWLAARVMIRDKWRVRGQGSLSPSFNSDLHSFSRVNEFSRVKKAERSFLHHSKICILSHLAIHNQSTNQSPSRTASQPVSHPVTLSTIISQSVKQPVSYSTSQSSSQP